MVRSASMTIGELARRAGVDARTIRFYGKIGLLAPRSRTTAGYRLYDESSLIQLRAIRLAKEAGLRLDEIGELLPVVAGHEVRCAQVLPLLERKREEVEEQIRNLVHLRDYLDRSIASCRRAQRKRSTVACPVLSPDLNAPTAFHPK
ncbi:MAG: MerR family transcriptional regulator [Gemmatimonadota bacterium]